MFNKEESEVVVLEKQLLKAAKSGLIDDVCTYIADGVNVNFSNDLGFTALMIASSAGHVEIVELLLECGAEVNKLSKKGFSSLTLAVNRQKLEIINTLIKHNADVNVNYGDLPLLRHLITKKQISIVKALLDSNRVLVNSIDQNGKTPLVFASEQPFKSIKKTTEIVDLLIKAGADVNIPDENGKTALINAAFLGYKDMIIALLAADKINIDYADSSGYTAAMHAVTQCHTNCLSFLLRGGANPNLDGQDLLNLPNLVTLGNPILGRAEHFTKISQIAWKNLLGDALSNNEASFSNKYLQPTFRIGTKKIYSDYAKDATFLRSLHLLKGEGDLNMLQPPCADLLKNRVSDINDKINSNEPLSYYDNIFFKYEYHHTTPHLFEQRY